MYLIFYYIEKRWYPIDYISDTRTENLYNFLLLVLIPLNSNGIVGSYIDYYYFSESHLKQQKTKQIVPHKRSAGCLAFITKCNWAGWEDHGKREPMPIFLLKTTT